MPEGMGLGGKLCTRAQDMDHTVHETRLNHVSSRTDRTVGGAPNLDRRTSAAELGT